MNNKLAIVIDLNSQMEKAARDAWDLLGKKYSIRYISSRSPSPHIAIDSGFTGKYDLIKVILKNFVKNMSPFTIQGNGLGIFIARTPVIYVRWNLNKEFMLLKQSMTKTLKSAFDKNIIEGTTKIPEYNWLAKTSLAFNDTSYRILPEILHDLKPIDFKKDMMVFGISLYKYSIEDGENKIGYFEFGLS